jgi:NAD(P)H-dependent FMN reductase
MTNILALVGSLRAASVNRQIAEVAAAVAESGGARDIRVRVYDGLADVPFYNEDLDTTADRGGAPATAVALRAAAAEADAVLVITPEYNGTIPAVLKNAIDWLSRPYGAGALNGKPLAVIGSALGRYGGVWAHDETRKSFGIAGARVIDAISLSVPGGALDGKHPRENAQLVADVAEALHKLAANVA